MYSICPYVSCAVKLAFDIMNIAKIHYLMGLIQPFFHPQTMVIHCQRMSLRRVATEMVQQYRYPRKAWVFLYTVVGEGLLPYGDLPQRHSIDVDVFVARHGVHIGSM